MQKIHRDHIDVALAFKVKGALLGAGYKATPITTEAPQRSNFFQVVRKYRKRLSAFLKRTVFKPIGALAKAVFRRGTEKRR